MTRKAPLPDLCFYHWSPVAKRKQILKQGLMPGKWSIDKAWKPPCICFADEPVLAWILSGRMYPHIKEWDLWMVYAEDTRGFESILDHYTDTGREYVKEYRVYHRIYKRYVHYIGTRRTGNLTSPVLVRYDND